MMNVTRRAVVALMLLLLGAGVSGLLLFEHRGHAGASAAVNQFCGGDGAPSGCETVARSRWSAPLGVPLAAVGLVFYLSLALLLALSLADPAPGHAGAALRAAFLALAAGLAVDLALLAVQAFAIHAFCRLCLLTYAVGAGSLALLWPARAVPLRPLRAREARPLALGWALSSIVAVAAVAAGDRALVAQQPSTTGALGVPGSLAEAQERVRTLQQTLDDPEKLQQYLSAKALHDFESAPVQEIDLASATPQGDPAAPLRVVTYSDFLCPFCRSLATGLHDFQPQTGGRMVVYFKNYPLDQSCNAAVPRTLHPGACWLARGAVCAQEQGRFQAYHDKVFSTQLNDPGEADVKRLGQQAGLDAARLAACLASPDSRQRVEADIAEGRRVGVRGTPTVLVNGKKLPSINTFAQALERESARLGLPPLARAGSAAQRAGDRKP